MSPTTPKGPYTVRLTGRADSEVPDLLRRAKEAGIGVRVSTALLEIEAALVANPIAWGDPRQRVHGARLTTYHRLFDELAVQYAVHDVVPLVWITSIVPVLKHPLRDPT